MKCWRLVCCRNLETYERCNKIPGSQEIQHPISSYTYIFIYFIPIVRCILKDNIKVNHKKMGWEAIVCINLVTTEKSVALLLSTNAENGIAWEELASGE